MRVGLMMWALVGLSGVASASDLDVGEGECVVFRYGEAERILVDLVPAACEQDLEEAVDSDLFWVFGDGFAAQGPRVPHRFADEGEFLTRISIAGEEVEVFDVAVANVPPAFKGTPQPEAVLGETWRFEFLVKDPGYTDEVQVALADGPEGMRLEQGDKDCAWALIWDAPDAGEGTSVSVTLRAWDGKTDEAGDWIDEGGEAELAFELVLVGERTGGVDDDGPFVGDNGDAGVDGGFRASAFTGSSGSDGCGCEIGADQRTPVAPLSVLFLGLLGFRLRSSRR